MNARKNATLRFHAGMGWALCGVTSLHNALNFAPTCVSRWVIIGLAEKRPEAVR